MRVLFILILLANLGVYALGQGWLGVRPEDEGRDPRRFNQELNPGAVTLVPKTAPAAPEAPSGARAGERGR